MNTGSLSPFCCYYYQKTFLNFKLIRISIMRVIEGLKDNKGRSPYNGRLSDFSFYIDSQISVHRKFKK